MQEKFMKEFIGYKIKIFLKAGHEMIGVLSSYHKDKVVLKSERDDNLDDLLVINNPDDNILFYRVFSQEVQSADSKKEDKVVELIITPKARNVIAGPPIQSFCCSECGGKVRITTGPGRTREYKRGIPPLPLPDDFPLPTCERCGETYVLAETEEELSRILEESYQKQYGDKNTVDVHTESVVSDKLEQIKELRQKLAERIRNGPPMMIKPNYEPPNFTK